MNHTDFVTFFYLGILSLCLLLIYVFCKDGENDDVYQDDIIYNKGEMLDKIRTIKNKKGKDENIIGERSYTVEVFDVTIIPEAGETSYTEYELV